MSDGDSSGPGAAGYGSEDYADASPSLDYPSISSGGGSGTFPSLIQEPQLVKPNEKYICPVHNGLLQNAMQTSCGHRLCQNCVNDYLGNESSKMCPAGEEDCEPVTRDNVVPDPGFRKEIKKVSVYCTNVKNGCKEQPQLQHLQEHVASCLFREVVCPFSVRGCTERKIIFSNLEKHQAECGFRIVTCDLCGQQMNAKDKKDHDESLCPEAIVPCPYKCGEKNIKRKDLENHKMVCPNRPTECQYKSLGCTFTGDKKHVKEHEKNIHLHFEVLLKWVITNEIQRRQHTTDVRENKDHITELRNSMDGVSRQLRENFRDCRLKLVTQAEQGIETQGKVAAVEAQYTQLQAENVTLKAAIDQLKTQVATYERQQATQEIRMTEIDLRFQMIETASYDGKLLWKIRDFTQRKRDAVQGRTVSLYSQPFYTGRFGYKMCARVYLNGDGIGRNTHMSLYFVVMRGEYDALLPWPFQHKVSLMLLDQSPEKRHLKDEFFPDPNSTSFRRPVNAEMNVASGCPLFVAHTVLDNPNNHYIKDDVIFIKVMVDTSQLQLV